MDPDPGSLLDTVTASIPQPRAGADTASLLAALVALRHLRARLDAWEPDLIAAADLRLSEAELAAIERAVPLSAVAGTRYAAPLMRLLDSER